MEEEAARLTLLQTELNNLQSSSSNLDSIITQIKGWCVTTTLAIGGFALTYHKPALLLIGEGAVVGFFLTNCQYRMFQRTIVERNAALDAELRNIGVMGVLKGAGTLEVIGTATWGDSRVARMPITARIRHNLPYFWFEACRTSTFSLYAFLAVMLLIEFIILL